MVLKKKLKCHHDLNIFSMPLLLKEYDITRIVEITLFFLLLMSPADELIKVNINIEEK